MKRPLPPTLLTITLTCLAASAGANGYDPTWSRSDCSTYSYHGLNERYVYGSNKGWINNNKWDSSTVEGVDCASYVSRCLALPNYVPEGVEDRYPYNTLELFEGVEHMVRIYSVYDLQPWDIWVWRSSHGGPSPGHTGLFKEYDGSYMLTREALTDSVGVVERRRRLSDMVDWGCRYYRRENWAGAVVVAPTVTTNAASNVQDTSMTLSGTLSDDGGGTIDSRGFAWGTTTSCSSGTVDGTTGSTFTATLDGLQPQRQYYFRARAHNSAGWGYGAVRSFTTDAAPAGPQIIIDNSQADTSSMGTWGVSGGEDAYGANSLWARDGATYTWRFGSQPAGIYEVSMWWTEFSSRGTAIPVAINHAAGTAETTVNQQVNGGRWNVLGEYYFDGQGSVTLTADGSYPVSHCADAVKFVLVESNDQPVAVIDSVSPTTAAPGQQVTLRGHGSDDGSITAYEWSSDRDGVLGSTATFITASLSVGTHTLSFRVRDNLGVWSDMDEAAVSITMPSTDEYIIDNGDAGTSGTGKWDFSGGEDPYGSNSLWARDGASYSWNASLEPGYYEVFMWWTEFSSRSSAVPIQIEHGDGIEALTVNQQTDGGRWNSLGVYAFDSSGTVKLFAPGSYPTSYSADAVRFVKQSNPGPAEAFVMDNGDSGTSSWGDWGASGGTDPYGSNSLWARETAGYRWNFTPEQGGRYEISLWWTEFSSRGTQIPVSVTHRYGTASMTVNQQNNGGQWNVLGTYQMTAGQPYYVQVTTAGDGSTACADAVMVRWVSD